MHIIFKVKVVKVILIKEVNKLNWLTSLKEIKFGKTNVFKIFLRIN